MNIRRIAVAGLAAAGVALGAAAVATPASADTSPYAEGTTLGPWPVLKRPVKNENVRALQWFLNCLGHKVDKPSNFGPATQDRVRRFQHTYRIPGGADGNVGAYTWTAILGKARPMGYKQRNDCVSALQVLLNKWDYGHDLAIDGAHGDNTRTKLRRFQHGHGLPVTGHPDTNTLYKLIATRPHVAK
ncbi:hypothetical protein GCM10009678_24940 [Actinomadura kijaniata]|uniref:Peptidoglycan hydrolase-like protein with peptidoglycan-binding domain n=1 Tax=Actinomadura namibiensis TaxID=182080 RepID=A0A7W3LPB3_ACTNM|nr:peptidoglycan-binding domain-containing protein [Actinomadura namibiensis]MBA8951784.1 peptidoglycan hydrolase-like protein with peptidoglycan-binding domain [Actinomadura namibiensis]